MNKLKVILINAKSNTLDSNRQLQAGQNIQRRPREDATNNQKY